ncbi:MAG: response regulator [Betaproteobacteria bacterium]|nr:MAG: response regulator [Betaproteobacteria bacterium]
MNTKTIDKVILLVEDNPDDQELALLAFKEANITSKIITCSDGEEALDYLFATGMYADRDVRIMPEVMLLDLKLPKVDGFEVLKRVREDPRTKLLPVVVLTTSSEQKDLVESYQLGTNSYIRKPVDFSKFIEFAQQFGSYWLGLNESPIRRGVRREN